MFWEQDIVFSLTHEKYPSSTIAGQHTDKTAPLTTGAYALLQADYPDHAVKTDFFRITLNQINDRLYTLGSAKIVPNVLLSKQK